MRVILTFGKARGVLVRSTLAACGIAFTAHAQTTPTRQLTIEKTSLGDGIYLFRAPSDLDVWTSSNSVVIVNDADVTVFDTNARPSTSRLVLAEIKKLTDKPVRTLINSHWHMDHWLGNEVYAQAFPGLQIIATTETRDYMRRMPAQYFVDEVGFPRARARLDTAIQTGKLADGTPLTAERRAQREAELKIASDFVAEIAAVKQTLPTLTFSDSLVLWSGGREFRVFRAMGDATGSAVLYLPKEKVLVTGDVLVRTEGGTGAQPWTLNSYAVSPWLATLRQLEALDATRIVPGQGPLLTDKTFLRMTVSLFDDVIRQVHDALEQGASTLAEVRQRVSFAALRAQFTNDDTARSAAFDRLTADLVRKAYQEAHDGIATP